MRIHTFADITTDNFTFKTSQGDPHTHLSQSSLLVETHAVTDFNLTHVDSNLDHTPHSVSQIIQVH